MELFRYCPICAARLEAFKDEDRWRSRCPACGWVHYRNPTVGVAVVLIQEGRVLLGERRSGGWCVPCGHVEWDETVQEAARREFKEETGLVVAIAGIVSVESNFHEPRHHTVGVWFRGKRESGRLRPGGDLRAIDFFSLAELPPLRFPTDRLVLGGLARSEFLASSP